MDQRLAFDAHRGAYVASTKSGFGYEHNGDRAARDTRQIGEVRLGGWCDSGISTHGAQIHSRGPCWAYSTPCSF